MPRKSMPLLAIGVAISLSACGMKGGLTMPPGPAPEPILGHAKVPPPAQVSKPVPANDLSTSKDPAK